MNFFKLLAVFFFLMLGCKSAPTILKEEVSSELNKKHIIIADTRSTLAFTRYHVPGSVSLNSEDFLILKMASKPKRVLDPDLMQLVERLARRGISPLKTVILITSKEDPEEGKKWSWLLRKLGLLKIEILTLDDYIEKNKPLRPKAEPERSDIWTISNKKNILANADLCFVNWSPAVCE